MAEANQPTHHRRRPSLAARGLIRAVRGYQVVLGPLLGGHCRFTPSCSFYAIEALNTHGAWRGSRLTLRRLLRCQPWGGCGHDPVP
ncbi:MAG: membrane protein insertion efficiency factor YidD [Planctomycetota bacterium]